MYLKKSLVDGKEDQIEPDGLPNFSKFKYTILLHFMVTVLWISW